MWGRGAKPPWGLGQRPKVLPEGANFAPEGSIIIQRGLGVSVCQWHTCANRPSQQARHAPKVFSFIIKVVGLRPMLPCGVYP